MPTVGDILEQEPETQRFQTIGDILKREPSKALEVLRPTETIGEVMKRPPLTPEQVKPLPSLKEEIEPEKEGSWLWDFVKTQGPELVKEAIRFGGSGATAAALGAVGAIPTGGLSIPLAAGLIYGGTRAVERLFGAPTEPTLSETITRQEVPAPEITRPFLEAAETALFVGPGKGLAEGLAKDASRRGLLEPVTNWVWENVVVKPTHIPIPYTGKTVQELFQPAIERIRKNLPKVGSTFQAARVQEALTREAFKPILGVEKTLLPSEKIELARGIAGWPVKSQKVKNVLYQLDKEINSITKPLYRQTFWEELQKLARKPFESVETKITPSSMQRLFKVLEKPLTGKAAFKEKEVHEVLRGIIQNPRFSPEVQQLAKDLWNLPAQLPLDVAKASHHASTEYLISKLLKHPGIVSSKLKPGYVESKHSSLKGLYVPKDVELELEAMGKVPQLAQKWVNKWFMAPWKTSKVVLRPATHARNLLGNLVLNDWGGLSPWRVDIYAKALKEIKNKGPIYREWVKLTGQTGRWGKEEMDQLIPALKYGANMFEKALHLFDTIAAPARALYGAEETWFKLAKYIHNLEKGLPKTEAVYDAMKWTLNYSEVTPLVAGLRTHALPFVTWQSKVIPLLAETAVKHPLRLAKYFALGWYMQAHALEQVGLTEGEWESIKKSMPEYMKKGMYLLMPWRDEKGQLKMLNLTWMIPGIGDISEIYQRGATNPFTLILQHPFTSIAGGLLYKKRYSGAPLYYDWEPATTKAAKVLGFLWEMWSPAPMPGNIDWKTLWDAIQERPEALTPEEAIASQLGFRLTTVNPLEVKRRSEALRRIHEAEMAAEMKRRLRKAKSPQETAKILDYYRRLRLGLREESF